MLYTNLKAVKFYIFLIHNASFLKENLHLNAEYFVVGCDYLSDVIQQSQNDAQFLHCCCRMALCHDGKKEVKKIEEIIINVAMVVMM